MLNIFLFRWYRARILSIRPEKEYDVFFVDYGDREWIKQDRIAPMRPQYLEVRFIRVQVSIVETLTNNVKGIQLHEKYKQLFGVIVTYMLAQIFSIIRLS